MTRTKISVEVLVSLHRDARVDDFHDAFLAVSEKLTELARMARLDADCAQFSGTRHPVFGLHDAEIGAIVIRGSLP